MDKITVVKGIGLLPATIQFLAVKHAMIDTHVVIVMQDSWITTLIYSMVEKPVESVVMLYQAVNCVEKLHLVINVTVNI